MRKGQCQESIQTTEVLKVARNAQAKRLLTYLKCDGKSSLIETNGLIADRVHAQSATQGHAVLLAGGDHPKSGGTVWQSILLKLTNTLDSTL